MLNTNQQNTNAQPPPPHSTQAASATTNVQTLKRRATKTSVALDKVVTLEKAFGFTITSNLKLAQSSQDGTIAYLAGCVIVLYDTKTFKQDFIISQARKTLTTLCFSSDGRVIATGESGHEPKVRIWDVKEKTQLVEFSGHKYAIECVCFSPSVNSNLIISIGSIHDMVVNVWNFKTKFKVASNKIACKVKGISFSKDGSYFVTVGNRHVKFWYLSISTLLETVPLKGRAAILCEMKNSSFCDVACGSYDCSQMTFAITSNGVLCEFDENRQLTKVIELRVDRAYSIFADDYNLYIGCSAGTILIFRQNNLEFIASLPRPHNLGVDISKGLDTRHLIENLNNCDLKYPDCVALTYNIYDYYLCAIYNDHSLYIWDIRDVNKVKKVDSHLFHSSSIWGLDIFSNLFSNSCIPSDTFITCSGDNTLRIWSLENINSSNNSSLNASILSKSNNIYSKELINILYIDNDLSALCETDMFTSSSQHENENSNFTTFQQTVNNNDQQLVQQNTVKIGAKCIKISPNGLHLATGDRNGNIRIYDLKQLESIIIIEAHESEILYLQYSQPESGRLLLASSSRDRLIHIFDAKKNYELIQTLDDHSAAITATRFCYNQIEKQFYLISCGSDKSIIFRVAQEIPNENYNKNSYFEMNNSNSSSTKLQFTRSSYVCEKMTFYDMVVDPTKNYINTVSQDRIVRTYSIKDGKKLRQFNGSLNGDGYLLKMDIDRTGTLLATSCTDKCVYIWDLNSCECLAYFCGHSELIIDLKFSYDNKYLITIGVDSCIFVWKLNLLNPLTNFLQQSSSTSSFSSNSRKSNIYNLNYHFIPTKAQSEDFTVDFLGEENDRMTMTTLNLKNKYESQSHSAIETINENSEEVVVAAADNVKKTSENNMRRSRAVWGPVCNTSFAVMVDNDSDENRSLEASKTNNSHNCETTNAKKTIISNSLSSNSSELSSLPIVQFPSPNVEKGLYTVVTVDPNIQKNKSLCLTIEEFTDPREDEVLDTPSTPSKEQQYSFYSPTKIFNNESVLSNQGFFNENDRRFLNTSSNSDSLNQRRQSLSARYLMKTTQQSSDNTPTSSLPFKEQESEFKEDRNDAVIVLSPTVINKPTSPHILGSIENKNLSVNERILPNNNFSCISASSSLSAQMTADMLKIKKNKTANYLQSTSLHFQHTESSLNKIKAKQQAVCENSKLNKSPSMSSVVESVAESNNESEEKSSVANFSEDNNHQISDNLALNILNSPPKLSSQFSDPNPINSSDSNKEDVFESEGNESNCLKKANSMISLNCMTSTQAPIPTSSSFHSRPICAFNSNNKVNGTSTNGVSNQINRNIMNTNSNNVPNFLNSNALPPKTVRQVKQKSSDRHLSTNVSVVDKNTDKTRNNSNLEKNRKLSSSSQNIQLTQATANSDTVQQMKKIQQRSSLYAKSTRKQGRSNTEELLIHQNGNEAKSVEVHQKENNKHANKIVNNHHEDVKISPKFETKHLEKLNQLDEEILWKDFCNNLNDLVLLGKFQKEIKVENLNQVQKRQRKELLTTFNKNTKSFIQQMELVSEKSHNNFI